MLLFIEIIFLILITSLVVWFMLDISKKIIKITRKGNLKSEVRGRKMAGQADWEMVKISIPDTLGKDEIDNK